MPPFYRDLGLPAVVTVHGPVGGEEYDYYSELGRDVSLVAISDRRRALAPGLNWAGRVHNALTRRRLTPVAGQERLLFVPGPVQCRQGAASGIGGRACGRYPAGACRKMQ